DCKSEIAEIEINTLYAFHEANSALFSLLYLFLKINSPTFIRKLGSLIIKRRLRFYLLRKNPAFSLIFNTSNIHRKRFCRSRRLYIIDKCRASRYESQVVNAINA